MARTSAAPPMCAGCPPAPAARAQGRRFLDRRSRRAVDGGIGEASHAVEPRLAQEFQQRLELPLGLPGKADDEGAADRERRTGHAPGADALDALGNTTAATGKGFAIGSAAVTALALFSTFTRAVGLEQIDLLNVGTVIGLFLGAAFPFLFSSLTIAAVGRAAFTMIEEVRRQFREIPGLKEGDPNARAEHAKCVEIATAGSLREMLLPGGLAIALPLVIGFIDVEALGGFLAGSLVTGFLLAIYMANAGGAWDNAKKFIEAGAFGGKGSDAHKAAVIGDTVGDPFKDTSGPALNIVLKVMTIVSLIFATAFIG